MIQVKLENFKTKHPRVKIFQEALVTISSNTTAHAIPNIFRSQIIFTKIFWFILLLAGLGLSIWYTCQSFIEYFHYPYSVHWNVYEKDLVDFPAVTFCNLNPFDSSKPHVLEYLDEKLADKNLSHNIHGTDEMPALFQVRQALKILKAAEMYDRETNKSFENFDIGFNLDDMLISCFYNGEKCNSSNFTKFFTFEFGYCYTFNKKNGSQEIHKTSRFGATSGLTLEVFTGFPGKQDYFQEKKGLYLAVHNNSHEPEVLFEGIKVPVGFASDVSVHRNFYHRLGPPYGNCRKDTTTVLEDDPQFYKETLKLGVYSKRKCNELCLNGLFIIKECNCCDPAVPLQNHLHSLCHTSEEIKCVDQVRNNSVDLSEHCDSHCPSDCNKIEYEFRVNYADYPSEYYFHTIEMQPNLSNKFKSFGNVTYNNFKQSVLLVNIFYDDLSYSYLEEIPTMSFGDALGIIGGQIGLFLGCSVLTFFEPIELVIEIVYKFFKTNKQKKVIQVKEFLK